MKMTLDDAPDVLHVEEVAQLLRIGRNGAYELVRSGLLGSFRIGRRIGVPKTAVLAFLERRRTAEGAGLADSA
jgi:excisionase family DNA binding protein